jgi:hypothetical protein
MEMDLEGVETDCQRQEKMEGTHRQPMFLMVRRTSLLLLLLLILLLLFCRGIMTVRYKE